MTSLSATLVNAVCTLSLSQYIFESDIVFSRKYDKCISFGKVQWSNGNTFIATPVRKVLFKPGVHTMCFFHSSNSLKRCQA